MLVNIREGRNPVKKRENTLRCEDAAMQRQRNAVSRERIYESSGVSSQQHAPVFCFRPPKVER